MTKAEEMYHYLGMTFNQETAYKNSVRERDGYTCQLCGAEGWQVDHIIPWRVSHDSSLSNLRILCRACNVKTRRPSKVKRAFPTIDDWYSYLESELAKYA